MTGSLLVPPQNNQYVRRKSLGHFDQETSSSARRASQQEERLDSALQPRRRSMANAVEAPMTQPMAERFRAPVRSVLQGDSTARMIESLKTHPLFRTANKLFVEQIVQSFTVELFNAGATILEEGETAYLLYFLYRGEVDVSVQGKKVATLSDGAFFGEMALLEKNSKRNATVSAATFCDCRVIHKDTFARLLKLFPAERAFFESEADRRAVQLKDVKKQAAADKSAKKLKDAQRERRGSVEIEVVQDLAPPFIAEAFLISAMVNRARSAREKADSVQETLEGDSP